jgi:hypothetical protein
MLKRLIEELIDASGWCASGYISRMINALSGFGEHNLFIGWENQIQANLTARLNNLIIQSEQVNMVFYEPDGKWYAIDDDNYISLDYTNYMFETQELTESEMEKLVGRLEDVVEKTAENVHHERRIPVDETMRQETRINVLLEQMMNTEITHRHEFLKLFRENISEIRENLWLEFRDHIKDEDFDMYFRKAILQYQGEN